MILHYADIDATLDIRPLTFDMFVSSVQEREFSIFFINKIYY